MTDKIPDDFSASDPAKVREMEVRDDPECQWQHRSVMLIKNGGACDTAGQWWKQYREITSKKMRSWTHREIMDFCVEKRPEVLYMGVYSPFWEFGVLVLKRLPYRLADGTEGRFEVEE